MLKLYIIAVCLMTMWSCKHQHGSSDSPLYIEVMAIHDKVMPEMSTIHKLKKQLKSIESPETNSIILDHIKALNDADEAMMTWMADFKVPEAKSEHEAYLKTEKEKIEKVSIQMYAAMDHATKLIDSLTTTIKN